MLRRAFKFVVYSLFSFFIVTCFSSILSLGKQQDILRKPYDKANEDQKGW